MDATDTFDEATRAEHVDKILSASIAGLKESTIAGGMYASVIAFSGDVSVVNPSEDEALFHSIADWALWRKGSSDSYLKGVTRDQTNIGNYILDLATVRADTGFRQEARHEYQHHRPHVPRRSQGARAS